MSSRNELLTDLADAIRELTEPRHHTEHLEVTVTREERTTGSGRRRKASRTRRRKAHTVTLPGLLEALRAAAVPGAADGGMATGGFESRPSAELEPLAVLREIIDDAGHWARMFDIDRPTLGKTISALVGAPHTDEQLARIAGQADRWVRRARLATGFDPAPFTVGAPCVYCGRRNSLVITGDLQAARCSRCGTEWTPDTIGMLANMLTANQHEEVLALAPCWMPDCTSYGLHTEHHDGRGRTWQDSCAV